MIRNNFFAIVIMFLATGSYGQVASASFGSTYVPSNGFISIFGNHTFDFADCGLFPGLILTERTGVPGVVHFTNTASWTDASDESHIDGYAGTFSSGSFVFPIGSDGRLRMLGISGSANASSAYLFEDPALFTGVMTIANADLDAVSVREYWFLSGDDETLVTLTWDQLSNVEDLVVGDINKLTIIGWTGMAWEVIPSTVNEFTLQPNSQHLFDENITTSFSIGSITSINPINPDDFELLTIGSLTTPNPGIVSKGDLKIFPNPARLGTQSYVAYDLIGKKGKMEIYDGQNRLVHSQFLNESSGSIPLPDFNLADDRYVITIIEEDGSKKSRYLIIIK